MLVNIAESPRVTLIVVALGRTLRLNECITSLVSHESRTSFSIVCVINPISPISPIDPQSAVDAEGLALEAFDIQIVAPDVNLGWAGGLHAGRALAKSDLLVWVQDDMAVSDGWLDALVAAADENPHVGAFGSSQVDQQGTVSLYNAGRAVSADDFGQWNSTDETAQGLPDGVTRFDWITSKGLLTRSVAWDDVGGPDPALFPLNHVDKDYCTHLRVHGWAVALVPFAHIQHQGNQSSPGLLREFLPELQQPRLAKRWAGPLEALSATDARLVNHDCTRERAHDPERWVAREASRLVVSFARWAEARHREQQEELSRAVDALRHSRDELSATRSTLSWKVTAPLRTVRRILGRRIGRS